VTFFRLFAREILYSVDINMESVKRFIGTNVLFLAQFLDDYFYHIAVLLGVLGIFNYVFVKNYDKELFAAAKVGNVSKLREALRNYADVNLQQDNDCTPLIVACAFKNEEVAKVLVETGKCKLELADNKGRTALFVACQIGSIELVKFLIQNKADIKTTDNLGNTPLIVSMRKFPFLVRFYT
jgi:ankyrin repeat protein